MTREKVHLAVETGFLQVPTDWSIESDEQGRRIAVPEVKQLGRGKWKEIDGWELRDRFLRLEHAEEAALQFLQKVGVWWAVRSDHREPKSDEKTIISAYSG